MTRRLAMLLTASLALTACGNKDLRPDDLTISSSAETKGRQLLAMMEGAHGSKAALMAHRTYSVELRDEWTPGIARAVAMPWEFSGQKIRLDTEATTDDSRITFLEGDMEGTVWGVQHWATYTQQPGEEPVFAQDDDVWFWGPTVQYFFEAPFRLSEGGVVSYAGQRELGGKNHDLVYITWGSAEPQDDIDQYVAWLDAETHRLAYLEYTVRDLGGFLSYIIHYEGYRDIQGVMVPTTMTTHSAPGRDAVGHKMTVDSVTFGVDLPDDVLRPRPELRLSKSDKGAR